MEALQSWVEEKRVFETEGHGLIQCTFPCATYPSSNGLQLVWLDEVTGIETDAPFWTIPVCMESSAPHQGEYATFGIADEVARMENPSQYPRRRPPARGCTVMASRMGIGLMNKKPD